MYVRKLPSGKWQVVIRRKDQPQIYKTFQEKGMASKYGKDVEARMERDIFELHGESEKLKDYIDNMCGMIEAETPLKEHDRWLEDMVALGYYKPEVTDGEQ